MSNVNVSYEEMKQTATNLRAGEGTIVETLTRLKGEVDALVASGFVTDQASGVFQTTYDEFTTASTKVINAIDGLAGFLDASADALSEVDSSLAKALKG